MNFFNKNQILAETSTANDDSDTKKVLVKIIHIPGNNCYSIVCCGDKTSITLRTNIGRSEDSPTFEVSTKSEVGKLFLDYLKHIGLSRTVPNNL